MSWIGHVGGGCSWPPSQQVSPWFVHDRFHSVCRYAVTKAGWKSGWRLSCWCRRRTASWCAAARPPVTCSLTLSQSQSYTLSPSLVHQVAHLPSDSVHLTAPPVLPPLTVSHNTTNVPESALSAPMFNVGLLRRCAGSDWRRRCWAVMLGRGGVEVVVVSGGGIVVFARRGRVAVWIGKRSPNQACRELQEGRCDIKIGWQARPTSSSGLNSGKSGFARVQLGKWLGFTR